MIKAIFLTVGVILSVGAASGATVTVTLTDSGTARLSGCSNLICLSTGAADDFGESESVPYNLTAQFSVSSEDVEFYFNASPDFSYVNRSIYFTGFAMVSGQFNNLAFSGEGPVSFGIGETWPGATALRQVGGISFNIFSALGNINLVHNGEGTRYGEVVPEPYTEVPEITARLYPYFASSFVVGSGFAVDLWSSQFQISVSVERVPAPVPLPASGALLAIAMGVGLVLGRRARKPVSQT